MTASSIIQVIWGFHYQMEIKSVEACNGINVDTVNLDFSQAFDKVDHQIVIEKLMILGIGGKLLKWIESFLQNRHQHVFVNGFCSNLSNVLSEVPQGSVIGPLLFLIHIGDIDADLLHSFISTFEDDTHASQGIASMRDASLLQMDLNTINTVGQQTTI